MPEVRDRHVCASCAKPFVVVYRQADPDEPMRSVSVACPHCHAVNRVDVASAAASGSRYWTEKPTPGGGA